MAKQAPARRPVVSSVGSPGPGEDPIDGLLAAVEQGHFRDSVKSVGSGWRENRRGGG